MHGAAFCLFVLLWGFLAAFLPKKQHGMPTPFMPLLLYALLYYSVYLMLSLNICMGEKEKTRWRRQDE